MDGMWLITEKMFHQEAARWGYSSQEAALAWPNVSDWDKTLSLDAFCAKYFHRKERTFQESKPMAPHGLNDAQFSRLCDLVDSLTEMRLRACKHLSIEDFSPDLMANLLKVAQGGGTDER